MMTQIQAGQEADDERQQRQSDPAPALILPATAWHVDFSVLDREEDVWNCFTDRFYATINSREHAVVLGAVTFSGCAKGFDKKPFSIPAPSVNPVCFDEAMASALRTLREQDEQEAESGSGVTSKLLDSHWMSAGTVLRGSFRGDPSMSSSLLFSSSLSASSRRVDGNRIKKDDSRLSASNDHNSLSGYSPDSSSISVLLNGPRFGSMRNASTVIKSVQRFRQRRFGSGVLSQPTIAGGQTLADDRRSNSLQLKRVLRNFSITFLQCAMDNSAAFFRHLAREASHAETNGLSLATFALEHCKWPRRKTREEIDAEAKAAALKRKRRKQKRAMIEDGAASIVSNDSITTTSTSLVATPVALRLPTPQTRPLRMPRLLVAGSTTTPTTPATKMIPTPPPTPMMMMMMTASPPPAVIVPSSRLRVAFLDPPAHEVMGESAAAAATIAVAAENDAEKQKKEQDDLSSKDVVESESESDDDNDEKEKQRGDNAEREPPDTDMEFTDALLDYVDSQASTLRSLSFRGTQLSDAFVMKFSALLRSKRFSCLSHLDIGLTGVETLQAGPLIIRTLASAIAHCPTLRSVDFTGTPFSPSHVGIAFCAAVRSNVGIENVACVGCDRNSTKFERIMSDLLHERKAERERIAAERQRRREAKRLMAATLAAAASSSWSGIEQVQQCGHEEEEDDDGDNNDDDNDEQHGHHDEESSSCSSDDSGIGPSLNTTLRPSKSVALVEAFAL